MSGCVRSRECVELRQETVLAQMRKEMSKHYLPEKEEQLQCMTSFRSEPVSTQVEYGAAQCRAKQFYTERFLKNSLLSTLSTKIAPLFFFLLFPKKWRDENSHYRPQRLCGRDLPQLPTRYCSPHLANQNSFRLHSRDLYTLPATPPTTTT